MRKDLEISVKKNKLFDSIKLSKAFPNGIRGSIYNLEVGEVLFKQNDSEEMVYLLLFGEMNLIMKQNKNSDYKDLYPGDFFSNYQILDEPFIYTTAVAIKDSKLLGIEKDDFENLILRNDEIKTNIKKYFMGEFDLLEEKEFMPEKVKEQPVIKKRRFEVVNSLDNDLQETDQEKEILNKEEELNKIQKIVDSKISILKDNYSEEKKSRFQKLDALSGNNEFNKREEAVNEFSKVIEQKEAELKKKQKLIKQKTEKQKSKVNKQREELSEIESKLKKEILTAEKKIKNKLTEFQKKENEVSELEKLISEKENEINRLAELAVKEADVDKKKAARQIKEIQKKEEVLLKKKQKTDEEFLTLRDEFSKREQELLEKSKELESKEKELINKISNLKAESISEKERILDEKEKLLKLEVALLKREEEIKREKEFLDNQTKSEKKQKEKPVEKEPVEEEYLDFSNNSIVVVKKEDKSEPEKSLSEKRKTEKINTSEKETVKEIPEIDSNKNSPENKLIKTVSEELLHMSLNRDLKQMFSSEFYKDTRIVFINITKATFSDAITFKNYISNLIEKNDKKYIFDFSYCTYIDSTFLGAVLSALKIIKSKDSSLKLVISKEVESSLIILSQTDKLLKVSENLADAFLND